MTFLQQDAIQKLDWDGYCLFYDSIPANQYDCGSYGYEYFENYTNCRNLLEPLDGSKQCMQDALTYDWNQYCFDFELDFENHHIDIGDFVPKSLELSDKDSLCSFRP